MRAAVGQVAMVCAIALGLGCGADGEIAPKPEPRTECPRVDDYLAEVYALVEDGKMAHLAATLGSDVTADTRADLVATLIRLIDRFEPGTFAALDQLSGLAEDTADLQLLLADLARWVATDGPGAPYPLALGSVRRLLGTCEGPPVLQLLRDLLGDAELLDALVDALSGLDLGAVLEDLEVDGETGRPALKALLRNVMVAAQDPDFDVDALLELLAVVIDTSEPPWDALEAGVRRLLGPGPSLAAIQGLLGCLLDVDPDLSLVDLVFDLLTDPALDLSAALQTLQDTADATGDDGLIPAQLLELLDTALAFLVDDAPARRALADVLTAMLAESRAAGVLGDVAAVLEARILGDVIALLHSIATRSCPAPEPIQ